MSRLPIRVRLTAVFTVAMAVVLAVVGTVLYVRLAHALDEQIGERLAGRTDALVAALRDGDAAAALAEPGTIAGDGFAQVVDASGRIVDASPGFAGQELVTAAERDRAAAGPVTLDRDVREPDGDVEPARLRVTALPSGGGASTLVAGESLGDRRDALDGLLRQLWLVGPVALALAGLLGFLVSRAALRPVEEMRRRAAAIDADSPDRQLPLPPARDEIRRLGETLNAMLARLDAALARERRFTADASHELRTPLSLVKTELELALRRPRDAAELEAAVRSASDEVDRLVRLSEDLLVLAAADEGRMGLHRSSFAARDALEAVATRFRVRAAADGRTIAVGSDGPDLVADRARIEQAIGNLVDNALRHGTGTIRLESYVADGAVALRVRDDGPGISAGLLSSVFERFTRADAARTGGSTGLGLAIVQAIARVHGGDATATNSPSGGAEVTITLPAP